MSSVNPRFQDGTDHGSYGGFAASGPTTSPTFVPTRALHEKARTHTLSGNAIDANTLRATSDADRGQNIQEAAFGFEEPQMLQSTLPCDGVSQPTEVLGLSVDETDETDGGDHSSKTDTTNVFANAGVKLNAQATFKGLSGLPVVQNRIDLDPNASESQNDTVITIARDDVTIDVQPTQQRDLTGLLSNLENIEATNQDPDTNATLSDAPPTRSKGALCLFTTGIAILGFFGSLFLTLVIDVALVLKDVFIGLFWIIRGLLNLAACLVLFVIQLIYEMTCGDHACESDRQLVNGADRDNPYFTEHCWGQSCYGDGIGMIWMGLCQRKHDLDDDEDQEVETEEQFMPSLCTAVCKSATIPFDLIGSSCRAMCAAFKSDSGETDATFCDTLSEVIVYNACVLHRAISDMDDEEGGCMTALWRTESVSFQDRLDATQNREWWQDLVNPQHSAYFYKWKR